MLLFNQQVEIILVWALFSNAMLAILHHNGLTCIAQCFAIMDEELQQCALELQNRCSNIIRGLQLEEIQTGPLHLTFKNAISGYRKKVNSLIEREKGVTL